MEVNIMEKNNDVKNLIDNPIGNIYQLPTLNESFDNIFVTISVSDSKTSNNLIINDSIDENINRQNSNIKFNRDIKILRPPKIIIPPKKRCNIVVLTAPQTNINFLSINSINSLSINSLNYLSDCSTQLNLEKDKNLVPKKLPLPTYNYKSTVRTKKIIPASLERIKQYLISFNQRKSGKFCRMCFENEVAEKGKLISPCNCFGNLKYMHEVCLKKSNLNHKTYLEQNICQFCDKKYDFQDSNKWRLNWKNILFSIFLLMLLYMLVSLLVFTLESL